MFEIFKELFVNVKEILKSNSEFFYIFLKILNSKKNLDYTTQIADRGLISVFPKERTDVT